MAEYEESSGIKEQDEEGEDEICHTRRIEGDQGKEPK